MLSPKFVHTLVPDNVVETDVKILAAIRIIFVLNHNITAFLSKVEQQHLFLS